MVKTNQTSFKHSKLFNGGTYVTIDNRRGNLYLTLLSCFGVSADDTTSLATRYCWCSDCYRWVLGHSCYPWGINVSSSLKKKKKKFIVKNVFLLKLLLFKVVYLFGLSVEGLVGHAILVQVRDKLSLLFTHQRGSGVRTQFIKLADKRFYLLMHLFDPGISS